MPDALIPGGYILLSRKIIESDIWQKPPLYLKVWTYLLAKAQHTEYKNLARGQLVTSIPEIMEACSWYVGYRKVTPTKDQIFQVIKWLREGCAQGCAHDAKATMIATTKATQSMVVTISNYDLYQTSKNYESNDEHDDENATNTPREQRQPNNTNKNGNNDKNSKNESHIPFAEIIDYLNARTGKRFKHDTDAVRKLIRGRWEEGFTLDDFKRVIDVKTAEWLNDKTMDKFLRPATLFCAKNFEGYLNQGVGSSGRTVGGHVQTSAGASEGGRAKGISNKKVTERSTEKLKQLFPEMSNLQ